MFRKLCQDGPGGPSFRLRVSGNWPILVLAAGIVLTLLWSGFLLWALASAIAWLMR